MTRSDEHFHCLFRVWPDLFKEFLDHPIKGELKFESLVLKKLEIRPDGFFRTADSETPNYVVEIHGYRNKKNNVYFQLLRKVGVIGGLYPEEPVAGVILFTHKIYDPETEPWCEFARLQRPGFRVLYLEEVLESLAKKQPDHPFVATLTPYLASDQNFEDEVKSSYCKLKNADLPEKVKTTLIEIFMSWVMERSGLKSEEEVRNMLAELTPIEETPIYKHILRLGREKGREEGREEGLLNSIKQLTRMHGQGAINEETYLKCVTPFKQELQELRVKAAGRSKDDL